MPTTKIYKRGTPRLPPRVTLSLDEGTLALIRQIKQRYVESTKLSLSTSVVVGLAVETLFDHVERGDMRLQTTTGE